MPLLLPWLLGGATVGGVGYGAYKASNTLAKWVLIAVVLLVLVKGLKVFK